MCVLVSWFSSLCNNHYLFDFSFMCFFFLKERRSFVDFVHLHAFVVYICVCVCLLGAGLIRARNALA